jgi:GIY-YIG catalytic domain-containing protein
MNREAKFGKPTMDASWLREPWLRMTYFSKGYYDQLKPHQVYWGRPATYLLGNLQSGVVYTGESDDVSERLKKHFNKAYCDAIYNLYRENWEAHLNDLHYYFVKISLPVED